MTTGAVVFNNDWLTGEDFTYSTYLIDGLSFPTPFPPFFSQWATITTTWTANPFDSEQSQFTVGDNGINGDPPNSITFDLGTGAYSTGFVSGGGGANFCFFEADSDLFGDAQGSTPVATFHFCWGPQIATPFVQGLIDANLPALNDALLNGNSAASFLGGLIKLTSMGSGATLNCYYASLIPSGYGTAWGRAMFCFTGSIGATITINGQATTISYDFANLFVYVNVRVTCPVNTGTPTVTVELLQFAAAVNSGDVTLADIISDFLGPIVGDIAYDLLTGDSLEDLLNYPDINQAIVSEINSQLASILS